MTDVRYLESPVKPDPACPLCGAEPSILDLASVDYGTGVICAA